MEVTAKQKFTTKDMVETSLLIALVFIATKFINIRLPISINGGLVHLGTAMLFISDACQFALIEAIFLSTSVSDNVKPYFA